MIIYDKLDGAIMKGVNAGVRAYNWTTGRTKADLANKMLTIAPIADSAGFLKHPLFFSIFVPGMIFVSHLLQTFNKKCHEREENALKNNTLDSWAENYKNNFMKEQSYLNGFISCGQIFLPHMVAEYENIDYITSIGLSTGFGFRSASCFVIRADYLPPRKNCLSRGIENFKKWYESQQSENEGIPVSAFGRYYNLEGKNELS